MFHIIHLREIPTCIFSEQFLEAIPQMHICIVIYTIDSDLIFDDYSGQMFFGASFTLSLLSSTLGFTRFLMNGPCRILPNSGPCGGYATIGCLLLMFNIASLMISKCLIVMCFVLKSYGYPYFYQIAYDKKKLTLIILFKHW